MNNLVVVVVVVVVVTCEVIPRDCREIQTQSLTIPSFPGPTTVVAVSRTGWTEMETWFLHAAPVHQAATESLTKSTTTHSTSEAYDEIRIFSLRQLPKLTMKYGYSHYVTNTKKHWRSYLVHDYNEAQIF